MPDGANKRAFVEGCNCPIVVDKARRILVRDEVMEQAPDQGHIAPMVGRI